MESQKFCLKWDGFQSSVLSVFDHLRQDEELVDVTLCCEGQKVMAHRMMLSACSPYFRDLLKNNQCQQMIIFLRDTSAADLLAIIEFMYKGSVNVCQTQLASFIKTAEMLQIKGLSGDDDRSAAASAGRQGQAPPPSPRPPRPISPPAKRRRTSGQERLEPAPSPAEPPPPAATPQAPAAPAELKVEKVDLTDEQDGSLDATLGYVAEYEGQYAEPGPDLTAVALGGMAGPSQPLAEDGSAQGAQTDYPCSICSRVFLSPASLYNHKKQHQGLTGCPLCGIVLSTVPTLRRHLQNKHGAPPDEVYRLVPTEIRVRRPGT